jgi:hypothetical protein
LSERTLALYPTQGAVSSLDKAAVVPARPVKRLLARLSFNRHRFIWQSLRLVAMKVGVAILKATSSAKDQKTPPTVKCRRFLHFRNLKHRNLSRLILRQSVTTQRADPSQPPRVLTSASARTVPADCGSDGSVISASKCSPQSLIAKKRPAVRYLQDRRSLSGVDLHRQHDQLHACGNVVAQIVSTTG